MTALSRRTTIAWIAAASGSAWLGGYPKLSFAAVQPKPAPVGYGTDPNLLHPKTPWPLTLTPAQRDAARAAADLIIPADAHSPSAGSLHVDAFVDEWISAAYPRQQDDRKLVLAGLTWLDNESNRRFGKAFVQVTDGQRRAIFDDVAWRDRVKPGYGEAAGYFGKLRQLVIAGYYTAPEGVADLGYKGNTAIVGDYPGPTPEAYAHLQAQLKELALPEVSPMEGLTRKA
jgi:Gluconate 2-dehydrogenase subunit 3